ncbi:hypothetical protein F5Y03DRAFT_296368 [Xylaria venustula]|nr:hypothetical protein F5Y03DRAFT_296368 [Xylaria venustula]
MKRKSASSHLERLPPELIYNILCELDGLPTLRCAILTCRLLYNAFTWSPAKIATQTVFNELDSYDVRPEAIAALQASKLTNPTPSSLLQFYKDYLQERNAKASIDLTMHETVQISRLHYTVSRLAEDFGRTRLQSFVAMEHGYRFQRLEPSTPEKSRIMRALYLVEAFFNSFRQTSRPDAQLRQCMDNFLLNFADWEVEQIACVHDFLFLYVSPIFNDMAAHDVFWGESEVRPALRYSSHKMQCVLFKGLVALESIGKAKTYEQQRELFDNGRIPEGRIYNLYRALKKGFHYNRRVPSNQDALVSSFDNSQDYAFKVKSPFFEDSDDGPFTVWKWAHNSKPLSRSAYDWDQSILRKGGYVMWDRARLNASGILRNTWQPRVVRRSMPHDLIGEVNHETLRFSWAERSRIYGEGGIGWWDFGDESRIVWTRKKKELVKAPTVPTSLDEAKRVILDLR